MGRHGDCMAAGDPTRTTATTCLSLIGDIETELAANDVHAALEASRLHDGEDHTVVTTADDGQLLRGVTSSARPARLAYAVRSPDPDDANAKTTAIAELAGLVGRLEPTPGWLGISNEATLLPLLLASPTRLVPDLPTGVPVEHVLRWPHLGVPDAYPIQLVRRDLIADTSIDPGDVPTDQPSVFVVLGDPADWLVDAVRYEEAVATGRERLGDLIVSQDARGRQSPITEVSAVSDPVDASSPLVAWAGQRRVVLATMARLRR